MARTKVPAEFSSTPGIVDNSSATALTIDSAGAATFSGTVVSDAIHVPGGGNIATNEAFGTGALQANTYGTANVASGGEALYSNTTGGNNVANGYRALYSNTTANGNVANGYQALYSNTTGEDNTATGYSALYSNTTGIWNVANGSIALWSNTTGSYNVANGYMTLYTNTTGYNNVANGHMALRSNTTGTGNIGIGYRAGDAITTGSNNTIIGDYAGTAALEGTIVLAAGSTERLRIDSTGNVGIGTSSPGRQLEIFKAGEGGAYRIKVKGDTGHTGIEIENTASSNTNLLFRNPSYTQELYMDTTGKFHVYNNSAYRFTVDQAGNVGIGTNTPAASLHIAATNNNYNGIMKLGARTWFSHTDEGQTHTFLANDYNDNAAQFGIRMKGVAESDEKFTILGSGNVGIGTTSPSATLEIKPTGADGSFKVTSDANSGNNVVISQGYNTYITASNNLYMGVGGTANNLSIVGGTVGIGTDNPQGRVDIRMNQSGVNWTDGNYSEIWDSATFKGSKFNDTMLHINTNRAGGSTGGVVGIAFSPGWQGHQNWGIVATNNTGGSYTQGDLSFVSQLNDGSIHERMRLKGDGNVGIGTTSPPDMHATGVTLAVAGPLLSGYSSGGASTGPRNTRDWFVYAGPSVNSGAYVHMKTDLYGGINGNTDFTMSMFTFHSYYAYGGGAGRGSIGFHNWAGILYNVTRTNDYTLQLVQDGYLSSDGYVVLVALIDQSYAQFSIDWMQYGGYPLRASKVTAVTQYSAATGAY